MAKNLSIDLINKSKYAQPPSWEQIDTFLKEMNMGMYHFEKFYGIPYNTLTQIKSGAKRLPPAYWHFIYEKIKPAYGMGFVVDYSINKPKNRINSNLTNHLPQESDGDAHNRLKTVK